MICSKCEDRGWYFTPGTKSLGAELCSCGAPLSEGGYIQVMTRGQNLGRCEWVACSAPAETAAVEYGGTTRRLCREHASEGRRAGYWSLSGTRLAIPDPPLLDSLAEERRQRTNVETHAKALSRRMRDVHDLLDTLGVPKNHDEGSLLFRVRRALDLIGGRVMLCRVCGGVYPRYKECENCGRTGVEPATGVLEERKACADACLEVAKVVSHPGCAIACADAIERRSK